MLRISRSTLLIALVLGLTAPLAITWAMAGANMRPRITSGSFRVELGGHLFYSDFAHSFAFRQARVVNTLAVQEDYDGRTYAQTPAPGWLRWRGGRPELLARGENFAEMTQVWGWPAPCLMSGLLERCDGTIESWGALGPRRAGITMQGTVPTTPIWWGYLLNAAVATAAVLAALSAPSTAQRIVRARRNQCLHCGYDICDLSICPECGTARGGRPEKP